jgi:hypothetical protein
MNTSTPPDASANGAAVGFPPFRSLEVQATPSGFSIAPRGPSPDLWIEAVVWVVASALLGVCLVFGGTVLRAIGAVAVVGIGVRALRRVFSRVPQPCLAGMVERVALHDLARLTVAQRQGLTGLLATTSSGAERWLVDLDPANADDYRALIEWVERLCQRRLQG